MGELCLNFSIVIGRIGHLIDNSIAGINRTLLMRATRGEGLQPCAYEL